MVESLDHLLNAFQSGLEQRDHLHQLSQYDGLTGVANRRHFDMFIAQQWQWAHRAKRPLSVIFIDIDNFKEINDTFGHLVGDATLETVAGRLKNALPPDSVIGRLAGDEFAVIIDRVYKTTGNRRLLNKLARNVLDHLQEPFVVQVEPDI